MKITPTIFNGLNELVLSEVFICNMELGLRFEIPLSMDPFGAQRLITATYRFANDDGPLRSQSSLVSPHLLETTFYNVKKGFRSETPGRLTLNGGKAVFEFYYEVVTLSPSNIKFTMTVYRVRSS